MKHKLIIAGALALFAFASPLNASAEDGSWTFKLAENKGAATKRVHAAIERVVADMNFVKRPIARSRLKDTNQVCNKYYFKIKGENISIKCDDFKNFTSPLSGKIVPTIGSDGESKYRLSQKVEAKGGKTVITQIFRAEDGRRKTIFVYDPDARTLSVSVNVRGDALEGRDVAYKLKFKEI